MAGSPVFSLQIDTRELQKNITNLGPKLDALASAIIDYNAQIASVYAKKTAPWHDRTGNARNGLHAATLHGQGHHELIIAHGVSYGIWLEVRWSGRYSIIEPTVRRTGPLVMQQLSGGMGRLK